MKAATGALVAVSSAEIMGVMAAFLPSPTTAYQGGTDPARMAQLKRGRIIGSSVALTISGGVAYFVAQDEGAQVGWIIFLSNAAILGVFLYEYERAIQLARDHGRGAAPAVTY